MENFNGSFTSLFSVNMGLNPGERIVVFTDLVRPEEVDDEPELERRKRLALAARAAADFAQDRYGSVTFISYPATPASGAEPPEPLWRAVFGDSIVDQFVNRGIFSGILAKTSQASDLDKARSIVEAQRDDVARVIIALANNSTSHTRFRSLANCAGGRFASLPHFDPDMFLTSMQVDWHRLAERTACLAARINRAETISVTCPNGTRMHFTKGDRIAKGDDGNLAQPGSFGNLPAGEVYLAPVEGTSSGVMVLEYAPTRKLTQPLVLKVEKGNVVSISGEDPYRHHLEQKFSENDRNRNIAELGIGTNDRASRPDNILEAEKILGTIHIALGDNSGFGGTIQTPFHEDFIFYAPTLTAHHRDGTNDILLHNGLPDF